MSKPKIPIRQFYREQRLTQHLRLTVEDACDLYRVLTNLTGELARQGNLPPGLNLDDRSIKALQRALDALARIDSESVPHD